MPINRSANRAKPAKRTVSPKRAFEARHTTNQPYLGRMRARCVEPRHVLGSAAILGVPKSSVTRYDALSKNACIGFTASKAVNQKDGI